MNIWKTDGTSTQTRVADLKQISFLRVDGANQGMQVKTLGGETVAVLFETEPIVTVASGTLVIKPDSTEALEIEISDIAEIRFGDMPNSITSSQAKTLSCIMQDDGALISGISKGITPPRIFHRRTPPARPACQQRTAQARPLHTRHRHLYREGRHPLHQDHAVIPAPTHPQHSDYSR